MKPETEADITGKKTNLLVLRLSAMGDVALTLPVIQSALDSYPNMYITFVTKEHFTPFFDNINRVHVIVAEVKGKHKGILGLFRLFRELKRGGKTDAVIDLHDVLRSRILSTFFRLNGTPVLRIDKGRKEKRELTSKKHKVFRPLKHTTLRYSDVFGKAGFPFVLSNRKNWFNLSAGIQDFLKENNCCPKSQKWIGIAPFSKHPMKMWPIERMKEVISYFDTKGMTIFLFGGGPDEVRELAEIAGLYKHVKSAAGMLDLSQEIALISQLDLMISMDSANMHLAWLSGIPVVSIWGATHPYAGFGPLNGNDQYIVQIPFEKLTCRPCSVYGNKPCWRGDHACMEWVRPVEVISMAEKVLNKK